MIPISIIPASDSSMVVPSLSEIFDRRSRWDPSGGSTLVLGSNDWLGTSTISGLRYISIVII